MSGQIVVRLDPAAGALRVLGWAGRTARACSGRVLAGSSVPYSPAVVGEGLRARFETALEGVEPGPSAVEQLCRACVDLLAVDGAAISLVHGGAVSGTVGSSNALARLLDEWEFTFGEGPCLDAVRLEAITAAMDLADPHENRWPVYNDAVLGQGVHAVYALPVSIHPHVVVGVLTLFRSAPGPLPAGDLAGGLVAADLAALPLLDLMTAATDAMDAEGHPWSHLAGAERVEVHQASGIIFARFGIDPTEALLRLRAQALVTGRTAGDLARAIVRREPGWDDGWADPE